MKPDGPPRGHRPASNACLVVALVVVGFAVSSGLWLPVHPRGDSPSAPALVRTSNHATEASARILDSRTTPITSIPDGVGPTGIAYESAHDRLFVTNGVSNNVTAIGALIPPPPATYPVIVTETGLPAGTGWFVNLNGTSEGSNSASVVFMEPNGTYRWWVIMATATAEGLFVPVRTDGVVQVNGSGADVSVKFALTAWLGFVVVGLPSGVVWTLTVLTNGTALSALILKGAGPDEGLQLICNRTYPYSAAFPGTYAHWDASGNATLGCGGASVTITMPTGISATSVPSWTVYGLVGAIGAMVVGALLVVIWRRPPAKDLSVGHP